MFEGAQSYSEYDAPCKRNKWVKSRSTDHRGTENVKSKGKKRNTYHDVNVSMKIVSQRLEKCSFRNFRWTIFSEPLSYYDSRIRLAGAHVGDLLLHDRPCSKDHHDAHWFLSKSEEVLLTLELPSARTSASSRKFLFCMSIV